MNLPRGSASALVPRFLRGRAGRIWERTFARLRLLGGLSDGNDVRLFDDGDEAFTAFLADIDAATQTVFLETYIFEPDALGRRVLDALVNARRRGCAVFLLVDAFGSPRLSDELLAPLVDAGGQVHRFNPWPGRFVMPPWVRDHRKILVADLVAYTGGMNISVDYAGPVLGDATFRDTMLRVSGPAVRHLAEVFQSSWRRASHSLSPLPLPAASTAGVTCLQVLSSAGRQGRRPIQRSLRQTIARATGRCFLTTPYFVPPPRLARALVLASRRGIDVRVLTAGISDVPLVRRASRHLYARLLRRGVRIFEYEKRTLHAKTVVIDGVYASVGTFNLDHWSWRRLLEVNVSAIGPQVATALEAQFHEDLRDSSEVTLQLLEGRGILERIVDWSAWLLLRW